MNEFKVVIAGGRDFNDFPRLCNVMDKLLINVIKVNKIIIISGGARGADTLGERYARLRSFGLIKVKADWNKYNKSAGFIRNKEMLNIADGVVCFWDEKSKGTGHMVTLTDSSLTPLKVIPY
jgi:hypothetical protein